MTSELNKIHLSDYEIILKIKKDRFFLSVPGLNLTASDNSLEQAYQSLTEKKEALLKELQEAELTLPKQESASIIRAASPQKFTASPLRDNVLGFMIKIVIVGVALVIIFEVSAPKLKRNLNKTLHRIDQKLEKLETIIPSKPGHNIEKELIRAGNKEYDPERQKRIEKSIRALVKRWKPAVKEIRPLFEE